MIMRLAAPLTVERRSMLSTATKFKWIFTYCNSEFSFVMNNNETPGLIFSDF